MNKPKQEIEGWNTLDWYKIERRVFKLQKQIYLTTGKLKEKPDSYKQVRKLQKTLLNCFEAKLLAVRKVTQDNRGKKTAGIDGVASIHQRDRYKLAETLRLTGKASPVRRIYIPKPGTTEKRPLGIPTIKDRALQALVKLALEPEWEAQFEANSYGFRPGRNCHDAVKQIRISMTWKPKYVLDADISKCFDRINHEKLLEKLKFSGKLRLQIKAWLKAGILEGNRKYYPTEMGTPQGGVISPLLANIALHGLEKHLKDHVAQFPIKSPQGKAIGTRDKQRGLAVIRYADDFIIMHPSKEILLSCKTETEKFLSEMGLELNKVKTRISHTLDPNESEDKKGGFDFLGFHFQNYFSKTRSTTLRTGEKSGFKTLIFPTRKTTNTHQRNLSKIIRNLKNQEELILNLNPRIVGWARYFGLSDALTVKILQKQDYLLYLKLRKWAKRNTKVSSIGWFKYWTVSGNTKTFGKENLRLASHQNYAKSLNNYAKIEGTRSPYEDQPIYWYKRLGRSPTLPKAKQRLLDDQKGKCAYCNSYFKDGDILEIHHVVPKAKGGRLAYSNLQLLHGHCHDRIGGVETVETQIE